MIVPGQNYTYGGSGTLGVCPPSKKEQSTWHSLEPKILLYSNGMKKSSRKAIFVCKNDILDPRARVTARACHIYRREFEQERMTMGMRTNLCSREVPGNSIAFIASGVGVGVGCAEEKSGSDLA